MTKKAEKAAAVLEGKKAAFVKRVRILTGHVFARLSVPAMRAAFDAGMTADDYAVSIAAKEPVGLVIHPLKVEAVARARTEAQAVIDRVRLDLEANGMDRDAAAPYPPHTMHHGYQRDLIVSKHNLYTMLTSANWEENRNADKKIVKMEPEYIARYIETAERDAARDYDAFICKMVAKVGEVTDASISGSHVWGHSILTVTTKVGGTVQQWKTQQIVNCSKLGNLFNQWPTRLMK